MELTRHREENDLLVGPLLRGIVVDGDATGCDIAALLGKRNVPVGSISDVVRVESLASELYLKTTSVGNASPGLSVVMMGNWAGKVKGAADE